MRLLLGSGGLRTPERQQVYFDEMASIFAECEEVVFIPYASDDHVVYTTRLAEFSAPSGVSLRNIDDYENAVTAIEEAKGLYVGGGNTFLLTKKLHENAVIESIERQKQDLTNETTNKFQKEVIGLQSQLQLPASSVDDQQVELKSRKTTFCYEILTLTYC